MGQSFRDNIKQNKVYWTYYIEFTKKFNKLNTCTGPFQVILKHKDQLGYGKWEINGGIMSSTVKHNMPNNLNNGGAITALDMHFFETEKECIDHYNDQLMEWSNNNTDLLKKIIK